MIKFSLNKKFVPHDPILLMELRRSIEITSTSTSTLDSFSWVQNDPICVLHMQCNHTQLLLLCTNTDTDHHMQNRVMGPAFLVHTNCALWYVRYPFLFSILRNNISLIKLSHHHQRYNNHKQQDFFNIILWYLFNILKTSCININVI
jgi:hypothetical protein